MPSIPTSASWITRQAIPCFSNREGEGIGFFYAQNSKRKHILMKVFGAIEVENLIGLVRQLGNPSAILSHNHSIAAAFNAFFDSGQIQDVVADGHGDFFRSGIL